MCKIFAITNASKIKNFNEATETIAYELLKTEQDGFGYAAAGKNGVFGEKTTRSAFRSRLKNAGPAVTLPVITQTAETFGQYSKVTGPAIFHGRISTNKPGVKNTHPMQREGWNLIHNGVVTDDGPTYEKFTDNDSEDLLHRLISGGIDEVAKQLSGYYAFCAIAPNGALHVARDRIAGLVIAWSVSHDTYILATNESLLLKITEELDIKVGPVDEWRQDYYGVFNNNILKYHKEFVSKGHTWREAQYSERSLGHALESYDARYNIPTIYDATTPKEESVLEEAQVDELEALKEELEYIDNTYEIFDRNDNPITVEDFQHMDPVSKLSCTVWRADGTALELELLYEYMEAV